MADKLVDQMREESRIAKESHSITAEYEIEVPADLIEQVEEEYDYDDAGARCAKAVAREKFEQDHDVPFNRPEMVAEADGTGVHLGLDGRKFTVVATK